jgi:hypothetical protein
LGSAYLPAESVETVWVNPLSVSVMETWAPGITAPLESVTVPLTSATAVVCAQAGDGKANKMRKDASKETLSHVHPDVCVIKNPLKTRFALKVDGILTFQTLDHDFIPGPSSGTT